MGWRNQWSGYVERLIAVSVAALGIGIGLTHRRPPATLVTAYRDLGLNLFEVPRESAFVTISRTAAQLIEEGRRLMRAGRLSPAAWCKSDS